MSQRVVSYDMNAASLSFCGTQLTSVGLIPVVAK